MMMMSKDSTAISVGRAPQGAGDYCKAWFKSAAARSSLSARQVAQHARAGATRREAFCSLTDLERASDLCSAAHFWRRQLSRGSKKDFVGVLPPLPLANLKCGLACWLSATTISSELVANSDDLPGSLGLQ